MINIQDFMNIELLIAEVKEAKEHPNADKLLLLKIDTDGEEMQIVAGIRGSYSPEQLVGKQIVIVSNLEPAVIRGEESHGMLLAASDEDGVSILSPDRKMKLGSKVK